MLTNRRTQLDSNPWHWLWLLPASKPICTKVVGGRVWTGISLSVSTIVHSQCQSCTSPPSPFSNRSSHSRHKFFANTTYIHTIQHASLFLRKDSRHTVQQTSQFLRKDYNNNNNNLTIPLQILQQQPQQQVLLSLSSVDVSFFSLFFFFGFIASAFLFPKASQSSTNSVECAF